MADNMIELVARINTDTSADEINKTDIPALQDQIKKLHIQCNLDTGSINALKKQFANLSSSLSSNGIKKVTNDIVKDFNNSFNILGKVGETSKREFNAQTKQMLQEFKDAWQKAMETGDYSSYTKILDKLEQRVREFTKGDIQQLKENIAEIRSFFTDGSKVSIGSNLKGWLDNATGSNELSRKYLDAIYGSNNYTIGKGNAGYDTLFKGEEDAVESIVNSAKKILEYQEKIKSTGWGLEELDEMDLSSQEFLNTQRQISEEIEDRLRKIAGLPELPKSGEYVTISDDLEESSKFANEILEAYEGTVEQSDELRRKQELLWQSYEKFIAKIAKSNLDINNIAKRNEVVSGDLVNYNEKFLDIMGSELVDTKSLREADDTLKAMNRQFDILNAHAEAEIPQSVMENLIQRISKTDSQIKILTRDFDELVNIPQNLQQSFDNLQTSMEGFDFNSDFRNMSNEEITKTVKQYTQIRVALNDVQGLMKVAQRDETAFIKKLEAHTKEIQKQLDLKEQEIQKANELNEAQMHDYWQGRFEETIKAQTAENQVLKEMKKYYQDIEKEATKAEKAKQQDEARTANLNNRVQRLAADMKAYAVANERAVNSTKLMSSGRTFSDTWSDIEKLAQKANLSDEEVKKLATDLQVFKKEARAAGVAGLSAFDKFLRSFKTMSSYITANMVFNYVKRSLRDMINEVTTVDTAMTELRKVTEATNEEFEAFAISAGKTGRELGASVSDVIDATATFARLGESLPDAEELGRVATLYKNVGDGISETTAAEDIISTMKAFKIEAQDAITIVDKLNEVGKYCCP